MINKGIAFLGLKLYKEYKNFPFDFIIYIYNYYILELFILNEEGEKSWKIFKIYFNRITLIFLINYQLLYS